MCSQMSWPRHVYDKWVNWHPACVCKASSSAERESMVLFSQGSGVFTDIPWAPQSGFNLQSIRCFGVLRAKPHGVTSWVQTVTDRPVISEELSFDKGERNRSLLVSLFFFKKQKRRFDFSLSFFPLSILHSPEFHMVFDRRGRQRLLGPLSFTT